MKWLERRMSKTKARNKKSGVRRNYWRNGLIFIALIALVSAPSLSRLGFGQQQAIEPGQAGLSRAEPRKESMEMPSLLTEVETLKGENLQLRYDSIDKQMRLIQAQFQQLQVQQGEIIRQLQALEEEVLEKRELKPSKWNVNWTKRTVQEISHGNTENPEKALEKQQ